MSDSASVVHRRFYCFRCGQLMFEFYRSPDGHFGLASEAGAGHQLTAGSEKELSCPSCHAGYRLLDRINPLGHPVERR
jgi:hypothetical protein